MATDTKWSYPSPCGYSRPLTRYRRLTTAAVLLLTAVTGFVLVSWQAGRRDEVGHPVAGVAALINASAPSDDIFSAQFCGGTLVSPDLVLTAAHCVADRSPKGIEVVMGADGLCRDRSIDGSRIGVLRIAIHPEYDGAAGIYDVAGLTLDRQVSGGVHLIASARGIDGSASVTALGWGTGSPGGPPSCRLMRAALELETGSRCAREVGDDGFRRFDPNSMICAIPPTSTSRDMCGGDSGGPLLVGSDLDTATLIGIVSWGRGCRSGVPGVYARADTWLRRN